MRDTTSSAGFDEEGSATRGKRSRGRPRDKQVDARILHAALTEMSVSGYAGMSMDAVADRAGVSKPTIYRRWPTKLDLATSSIATMVSEDPPNPETDVWRALVFEMELVAAAFERGHGISIIGNMLALEEQEPQLIARYREDVVALRRGRIRTVFEQAISSGSLPADTDVDLLLNMMLGYYYASYIGGEARLRDWPERCVEVIRRAVAAGRGTVQARHV